MWTKWSKTDDKAGYTLEHGNIMIDVSLPFYVPRFSVGSNENVLTSLTLSSKYSHIWLWKNKMATAQSWGFKR